MMQTLEAKEALAKLIVDNKDKIKPRRVIYSNMMTIDIGAFNISKELAVELHVYLHRNERTGTIFNATAFLRHRKYNKVIYSTLLYPWFDANGFDGIFEIAKKLFNRRPHRVSKKQTHYEEIIDTFFEDLVGGKYD